ncbi:diguanylate cyclase [Dolichospermum sp. UHCC 0259]|uniref:diguanylate cyclase n=1 Tax=Dolichospermum sp. UHCC 0259 TaxID=2590010 RepID=UPI001C2D16E1|nr:diguanylate cyclase [Dolichospermum sp. UHCC 0259]
MSESLVIIGLWIIPKIQKTPAECGHQSGDDCLIRVAQAIAKVMKRPTDLT